MSLTTRLLDNFDQIVIYGAKGWFGRSAVSVLFDENLYLKENQILLVGSKSESANIVSLPLDVYSSADAQQHIRSKILFLNSAYLRREKLDHMPANEFELKNQEIMKFGENLLRAGKIKKFINLSSGVASQGTLESLSHIEDPYAKCKIIDEAKFNALCESMGADLINCRIYSMSGMHLNEFTKLALSTFISNSMSKTHQINVNSPTTMRSYVDSIDLARVLFELSLSEGSHSIDSGGSVTSLGSLAADIAELNPGTTLVMPDQFEKSPDYFGDYETFNNLAAELGVELLDLEQQIIETTRAIKSNLSRF
jgi:nucleoside-diphosphate-sugar epimerase